MSDRIVGAAEVAAELGVQRGTIARWRTRYDDFPAPDAWVGNRPLWRAARLDEIRAWAAARPGQGWRKGRTGTMTSGSDRSASS